MTSPSSFLANAMASLVLPLAVGPWIRIAGRMAYVYASHSLLAGAAPLQRVIRPNLQRL